MRVTLLFLCVGLSACREGKVTLDGEGRIRLETDSLSGSTSPSPGSSGPWVD